MIFRTIGRFIKRIEQVNAGMTKDQVREVLGKPDDIKGTMIDGAPVQIWIYRVSGRAFAVAFMDGQVAQVEY